MNIEALCINKEIPIINAIKLLDKTNKKILLVIEDTKLIGVVTDGDIRRWIIKNGDLNEQVKFVMNSNPVYLYEGEMYDAEEIMRSKMIEAIPIVDRRKRVIDIVFWNDKFREKLNYYNTLSNPVVIMAGGKGTRLKPYTQIIPKPLIPIGDKSILERIINNFREYGCHSFYLTLNYKKNMIKAYLGDQEIDYEVNYIEEEQFLGTGGSLYLLKGIINDTFFVSNCDVLVDANYSDIIQYHKEQNNKITMITSLRHYNIPYGVIHCNNEGNILNMEEKPEMNFQINTGMYVLEPRVLEDIPENRFFHITDLINMYIERGEKVGAYPVTENSWLDMGEMKEMDNMLKKLKV